MKTRILLFIMLLFSFSAFSQETTDATIDKGSGILYFSAKPGTTPVNPDTYSVSEFAMNTASNPPELWVWNRTSAAWERQFAISQGDTIPTTAPSTGLPRTYIRKSTGAIYVYNGSAWVELGTGGGGGTDDQTAVEVPFTPTGNILSSDVQSMGEELQTQIDAIQAAFGISNGAQNLGSFLGNIISDNETTKGALQDLEDASMKSKVYDNLNSLPITATNGDIAYIKGYYSINDDGGGFFKWESNRSKSEANAGSIFDPSTKNSWDGTQGDISTLINAQGSGSGNGCWVRLGDEVNTAQFGLINDQSINQFAALKNAIEKTTTNFNLVFDTLYYAIVTSSIEIPKRVKIKSKHPKRSGILIDTTSNPTSKFILLVNDSVTIEGLKIESSFRAIQNNQMSFIVGKDQGDIKDLTIDNCSFEGLGCTFVRVNGENLQVKNTDHLNGAYGSYSSYLIKSYFYNNYYQSNFKNWGLMGEGIKTIYGREIRDIVVDRCRADSLGRDLLDTTGGLIGASITNCVMNYCQGGTGGIDLKRNFDNNTPANDTLLNKDIVIDNCIFNEGRVTITNSFVQDWNTNDSLINERLARNVKISSTFINSSRPIFVKRGVNVSVDGSVFDNCTEIFYSNSDAESAFSGNQALKKRVSSHYKFINNEVYQDTTMSNDTGGQFYNANQITISGNTFKLSGESALLFNIDSVRYANVKNNDISISKLKGSQNLDLFKLKDIEHATLEGNTVVSDSTYTLVDFALNAGVNKKVKLINNTLERLANMYNVFSGAVDTVFNINNDLLNTNEFQNLTTSNIYYKTNQPQIQSYSETGSTQTINLQPDGGTIELDLSSYDATLTLTVNQAIQGKFYLFRIFGADQDVVFPSTFKQLDGSTNLGTISNSGTTSIPCYFDGTNFICKN